MKHISVPCLIIFLITATFMFGCKKDETQNIPVVPKVEYSGNYSFTTTLTQSTVSDTTILYNGYVKYDDFLKQWIIRYLPYQIICPDVDSKGVITYPDFVNTYPLGFFSGNFDGKGNVNFKFGYSIIHHGETYLTSYTVNGKRK